MTGESQEPSQRTAIQAEVARILESAVFSAHGQFEAAKADHLRLGPSRYLQESCQQRTPGDERPDQLRKWIADGRLPAVKIGSRVKVLQTERLIGAVAE